MTTLVETTAAGTPVQLAGLDDEWLLDLAAEAETQSRVAERRRLRYVARWCAGHLADPTGLPEDRGLLAVDEQVGGEGCPPLAAFSAEPLAVAFSMSTGACLQLMADVQDLVHRLPNTWALVDSLALPAWRARRLAQATTMLNPEAAADVDVRLAPLIHELGPVRIDRACAEAAAAFDPAAQAAREEAARRSWEVRTGVNRGPSGEVDGSSWLAATGDTDDLARFDHLVGDVAAQLATEAAERGETDPEDLGVRRARALGRIADLLTGNSVASDTHAAAPPARRRRDVRYYVHVDATDDEIPDVVSVERLGALTAARLAEWLPHTTVKVVPVIDTRATRATHPGLVRDAHDPSDALRETVVLRDGHCVFPHCTRDARQCDLDHIEPYVPPDEGGPPGQTRPENLAPLCRRHHRLKTRGTWSYVREDDGGYTWTDPHGVRHRVVP